MNQSKLPPTARLLTSSGRGAVATIAVQAEPEQLAQFDGYFSAVNGKPVAEQRLCMLAFGHWGTGEPREELLICRTTDTNVEIHCHGGTACVERVLADLAAAGIPFEHTGKSIREQLAKAVTHAPTLKTADRLLKQQQAWPEFLNSLLETDSCEQIASEVTNLLSHASFGQHLLAPWDVAIVGAPNVGKSTLLNALLGFERSIVFNEPGTTRDVVSARTVFDGWPILLSDTAGIRQTSDSIETTGVQAAQARAESADIRLIVTDVGQSEPETLDFDGPVLRVGNKADLISQSAHSVDICVSATTGQGVDELIGRVCEILIPNVPDKHQAVPVLADQVALLNRVLGTCESGELQAAKDLVGCGLE